MLVPIAQRNAENGKNYAMSLVLPRGWLILFYTKGKLSDVVGKIYSEEYRQRFETKKCNFQN